jgi:hypothetical protein
LIVLFQYGRSDQRASLALILLQRTKIAATQHMGLKGRLAYPPDRLLNRANIYYSYNT